MTNSPSETPRDPNATGYDALSRNDQITVALARPPGVSPDQWNYLVGQSTARGATGVIAVVSAGINTLRNWWHDQKEDAQQRGRYSSGPDAPSRIAPITFAAQIGEKPENGTTMTWLERLLLSGLTTIGVSENARDMARSATEAVGDFVRNPTEGIASAGRWIYRNGREVLRGISGYIKDRLPSSESIINRTGEVWDWMKNSPSELLTRARGYLGLTPNGTVQTTPTLPDGAAPMQDIIPAPAAPMSSLGTPDLVAETAGPALGGAVTTTATLEGGYRGRAPAYSRDLTVAAAAAIPDQPRPAGTRRVELENPRPRLLAVIAANTNNAEQRLELA